MEGGAPGSGVASSGMSGGGGAPSAPSYSSGGQQAQPYQQQQQQQQPMGGGGGASYDMSSGGGGGGGGGGTNSTIYVGNLVPFCTQADLIPLFQSFGYIVEIRMQADRGFAFIKLDTNENASNAINNLSGTMVHGRGMKCSWGKDRMDGGGAGGGGAGAGGQQNMQYQVRLNSPFFVAIGGTRRGY